jgi:acyl carrier protein
VTATIDQIRDYLRQRFPALRNRQIDDHDKLLEGGIIDSLAVLDLVAYLETQFNITLADDDLVPETFQSLASLAAFVEAKAKSAPAPS